MATGQMDKKTWSTWSIDTTPISDQLFICMQINYTLFISEESNLGPTSVCFLPMLPITETPTNPKAKQLSKRRSSYVPKQSNHLVLSM